MEKLLDLIEQYGEAFYEEGKAVHGNKVRTEKENARIFHKARQKRKKLFCALEKRLYDLQKTTTQRPL